MHDSPALEVPSKSPRVMYNKSKNSIKKNTTFFRTSINLKDKELLQHHSYNVVHYVLDKIQILRIILLP